MSFQTFLNNRSPFLAERFVLPDNEGQEVLLIVVMASFEATAGGDLKLADDQIPIRLNDEYYGDLANSSIRYESSIALEKSFVDVLVNGYAYAPDGKTMESVPVRIAVGDINKTLIVTGDRLWSKDISSKPKPFQKMPIVYERAFGGVTQFSIDSDGIQLEPRNPVGIGFRGAVSANSSILTRLPNVEYPSDRMKNPSDRITPAGLGAIGRSWKPRIDFAGTYGDAWLSEQWPLLPKDFDSKYNQTAPIDQQSKTISGGETASLINMTVNGRWDFRIPVLNVPVNLFYDNWCESTALHMDTVLIEPDLYRLSITARLKIDLPRNRNKLREIVLGHMTSGWFRARKMRKSYIDNRGTAGMNLTKQYYLL